MQHVVLTRFNCRFGADWTKTAVDPAWLAPRFDLFERYCLPSVLAQQCQAFLWLIFFDAETPEPFASRAAALAHGNIRPQFVGTLTGELIRTAIRKQIADNQTHVITTRLDNDDGLASDFIGRVQAAFVPRDHKEYLNVTEGFILSDRRLYRWRHPHNAFVSLVEPTAGPIEGVWTVPHTQIARHAPVRQIAGGPGWLQVIHGANVSNKVRGKRSSPEELGPNFILDRQSLAPEKDARFYCERFLMSKAWAIRDLAATASRVGKQLIGRGWKPS